MTNGIDGKIPIGNHDGKPVDSKSKLTFPTAEYDEIFVEKHNAFLKNGEPDDDYIDAKLGLYQFRVATVHYKTEKEARDKLQQILSEHEIVERLKERKTIVESRIESLYNQRWEIMRLIKDNEVLTYSMLNEIDKCGKIEDEIQPLKKELEYLKSILENN